MIRVENLSKEYVIGRTSEPYSTLRESLTRVARRPLESIRRKRSNANGHFLALKDVSFEVKDREVVGIIGRNGAGKSTLLKILSRITEPTSGRIELYGRVGSLLEVGTGFHPELTGRENIFLNGAILGMKRDEIARKFDEIVDFAEIGEFLETPVKRYSSGMYMRLAFAVAAYLESEILVVDEVLAVGDAAFQMKCLGKMEDVARGGRTVLFVSHNMGAVARLCERTILLENGSIREFGDTTDVIGTYLRSGSRSEYRSSSGPVRYASIRQIEERIVIVLDYRFDVPVAFPCLGFAISDVSGAPVFGTNPKIDNVQPLREPRVEGRVQVSISEPLLIDGTYHASLWFGDGKTDFFVEKDCLTFEVVGMASNQHGRPGMNGYVYPTCEWELDS